MSYVYFIRERGTDHYKVGYTSNHPEKRMAQLQTGSAKKLDLVGWVRGTEKLEKALHVALADVRMNGEWFECPHGPMAQLGVFEDIPETSQEPERVAWVVSYNGIKAVELATGIDVLGQPHGNRVSRADLADYDRVVLIVEAEKTGPRGAVERVVLGTNKTWRHTNFLKRYPTWWLEDVLTAVTLPCRITNLSQDEIVELVRLCRELPCSTSPVALERYDLVPDSWGDGPYSKPPEGSDPWATEAS